MTPNDDEIRSRLHADATVTGSAIPASVVFGQLRPRMRRARRLRRIVVGSTGVVLVGATGVALQMSLDARSTTLRMYGDNQGGVGVDELTPGPLTDAARDGAEPSSQPNRRDASATTTSTTEPTTNVSASVPASPVVGVPATPTTGQTPLPTTEPSAPVDDPTATTSTSVVVTQPPTTPTGTHRIDSACGSIGVETVDDRVDLVDVTANPGFEIDIKSDGPVEVEVGMHSGDVECEIEARVVGGQLVATVEGPEEEGPEVEGSEEEGSEEEGSGEERSGEGSGDYEQVDDGD